MIMGKRDILNLLVIIIVVVTAIFVNVRTKMKRLEFERDSLQLVINMQGYELDSIEMRCVELPDSEWWAEEMDMVDHE